jgi:two-component system, sensor histidine kinase
MQGRIGFLVENDEDLRRAMGLVLEKWGVDVLEAASGEAALALIDELGILPDFFLIDHRLGEGINGLQLITRLRELEPDVPLMLVTADHSPELRAKAEAMAVDLLMKPIDAEALRRVMAGFGLIAPATTIEA